MVYNRTEAGQTKILKGHQSYTTQVRWFANGILVSSGNDNTIRFWDAAKGRKYLLVMFTNGSWVLVTPNGQFDASEDAMKKIVLCTGYSNDTIRQPDGEVLHPQIAGPAIIRRCFTRTRHRCKHACHGTKVKLSFDAARNLEVADDVPKIDWANESISVTVNAECTEDAIDEVRLYLNGKLIESQTRNLVVEPRQQQKACVKPSR